jgi:glycosyltransferase involved in cell wall biosynthesis
VEKLKKTATDLLNVKFVGPVFGEAKWDFLRSGDVMVLPTYSENFGIVVAESLAVGVPVITTKGTPWEELNTTNCGWWIDLSELNLKKAIEKVITTDEKDIKMMGYNGKRLVNDKYDVSQVAKNMFKLYKKNSFKNG